jgi:flagellar basal body-associated protein FliL
MEHMSSTHEDEDKPKKKHMRKKSLVIIASALVLVAIIAIGVWSFLGWLNTQRIDTSKYQVVYLANGQAYFGKLQNTDGDYLVMKNPYIAQNATDSAGKTDTSQTTLLKVSDQVYGPDDSIAIHASQVTFWQNLRDDSKVTQAIRSKE